MSDELSDLFEVRDEDDAAATCLSELALDQLLADEDPSGALRARLDGCGHCQDRFAKLVQARDEYLEQHPPHLRASLIAAVAAAQPSPPSLWRRMRDWRVVAPLSALMGAAVVLLVMSRGGVGKNSEHDVVRLKGGERFSVLARSADGSFRRVASDTALPPGTRLGFRVACSDRCNLTMAGIGETGAGYVVDRHRTVVPGRAFNPDFTVELDDSPGSERFYAAFCSKKIDADDLVKVLEASYRADKDGRRQVDAERAAVYDGCVLKSRAVVRAE